MAAIAEAADLILSSQAVDAAAVCALVGDELFLKTEVLARLRQSVLGDEEGEFSLATFDGRTAEFRDVREELATLAMFGGGKRLVVVDDADEFVSRHRQALEDYVEKPARSGVLVLALDTLPSNTRLYKAIAAKGLLVRCEAPKAAQLSKWLTQWARQIHQVQLPSAAADALLDRVGPEMGLLNQELAKLALAAGPDRKVTAELVDQTAGGWRTRTTWEMLDAALAGKTADALTQLDRLLASGEEPVGLLAQISGSLRRYAAAARLIAHGEATGRRLSLVDALKQAGIRDFVLPKAEKELRRLGRRRAGQVCRWLLEADLDLKGDSSLPNRLILERLIVRLAAAEPPATGAASRRK